MWPNSPGPIIRVPDLYRAAVSWLFFHVASSTRMTRIWALRWRNRHRNDRLSRDWTNGCRESEVRFLS
jgi:hypothetical protein